MTNICIWCPVFFAQWIEMWTSRRTAICIVSEFVNMETMQTGCKTADFTAYFDCRFFTILIWKKKYIELKLFLCWMAFNIHIYTEFIIMK